MRLRRRRLRWAALVSVMMLVLAACGDDDTAPGNGAPPGEALLDQYDFSGVNISVGSKDFDEQLVLGWIAVHAFEYMGATVENNVDLGGTAPARAALLGGDIDTYFEYNGTGYSVHLAVPGDVPDDPDELTSYVRENDLEQNNIHWLSRAPFNNTYGFVASPALNEAEGAFDFDSMAAYLQENPDAVVCMESEFPVRDDGLVLFTNHTGYEIPQSQRRILDTGIIYTETGADNCDFGEVFTTDGRIEELGLTLVDDQNVMILYNISMNLRDDKYQENPEEFEAVADLLLSPLTQERMVELNYQVSSLGDPPEAVARQYLIDEGLIEG